ncbi:MAG: hypothetical protein ACYDA1_11030, partial [Vulcanimicrobiaceae bacterium]
ILLRMSNLVGPLVKNIENIHKKLNDPEVFPKRANNSENALLLATRDKLRTVLAWQSAQLDIINGFVQTQQMHQMQHDGFGYLSAMSGSDIKGNSSAISTPDPLYNDQNLQAGLTDSSSPVIDVSMIPGLQVGYNPLTRLIAGVRYVQRMTGVHEQHVAQDVTTATRICAPRLHLVPVTPQP